MTRRATGADPRTELSSDILAEANRLAMPRVAIAGGDTPVMAIGAALAVGIGVFTFMSLSAARLERENFQPPEPAPVVVAEAETRPEPVRIPPRPEPVYIPAPSSSLSDEDLIQPERLRAPTLIVDNGAFVADAPTTAVGGGVVTPSEAFAMRITDNEQPPATATQVEDLSSLVLEGTMLAGVLETAINSDLPGYVRAIVSDNVWSFDGRQILVPRGSRLIGQYRSGLAIGESRAFVIWTRLVLPDGVSIRLASPATDALGRAGLGGKVDRHFVQRFGSAILLSVIGAGLDAAVDNSDNQVVIGSSSDAYSIAQAALQGSISIPPTIKIKQGSPIRIFVARDLYFPAQPLAALR